MAAVAEYFLDIMYFVIFEYVSYLWYLYFWFQHPYFINSLNNISHINFLDIIDFVTFEYLICNICISDFNIDNPDCLRLLFSHSSFNILRQWIYPIHGWKWCIFCLLAVYSYYLKGCLLWNIQYTYVLSTHRHPRALLMSTSPLEARFPDGVLKMWPPANGAGKIIFLGLPYLLIPDLKFSKQIKYKFCIAAPACCM